MKILPRNINSFLKSLDKKYNIAVVYGPDTGLVKERATAIAKLVVPDLKDPFLVSSLNPDEIADNQAILIDEALSIPFGADRKLIRIPDATDKIAAALTTLVEKYQFQNYIVIEADNLTPKSSLRKLAEDSDIIATIACYNDDDISLSQFIGEFLATKNLKISNDAKSLLVTSIISDRMLAKSELEKLSLYAMNKDIIELEDVINVISDIKTTSAEDPIKYALSGNFTDAAVSLEKNLKEDVNAIGIIRISAQYLQKLFFVRAKTNNAATLDAAISSLYPPLFFKNKDIFMKHYYKMDMSRLEKALTILTEAETLCKRTGYNSDAIVNRALLSIAGLAK